jgi:biotin/methionine sulfoxide reductase
MLLHPGAAYDYDGQRRRYPDVKLVYWSAVLQHEVGGS